MLEITFGEIADGWADVVFDFGQSTQVKTSMSYLTDPFEKLAELTLRMLHGAQTGELSFTDEYDNWFLSFQKLPDGLYRLHLERWTPWSVSPTRSGGVQSEDWPSDPVDPWHFGFQVWSELARVQHQPGVLRWCDDEEGCLAEGRFNQARTARIAELKKALIG